MKFTSIEKKGNKNRYHFRTLSQLEYIGAGKVRCIAGLKKERGRSNRDNSRERAEVYDYVTIQACADAGRSFVHGM